MAAIIVGNKDEWNVMIDDDLIHSFPGDEDGFLSAQVLRDILNTDHSKLGYQPEEEEVEEVKEHVVQEPEPKERKPRDENYPFPPGVQCFWWPRREGASVTGSYDGTYQPSNGDNLKVVIRRSADHGYLVANTRALKHALQESGALPGDIIQIRENGKGLLQPTDRGPAQLFTVEIIKKREDRNEEYVPGKN